MNRQIFVIKVIFFLVTFTALGAATVWAAAGPLVKVSGASPFGPLANCGNFPGIFNGTNFVDSEVEPWVAVNPVDPDNIVAFWQQDRWSDGGSGATWPG